MSAQPSFLQQTSINFKTTAIAGELRALQANILKGHGRDNVHCIFLDFAGAKASAAKSWISQLTISNAFQQLDDTEKRYENPQYDGGPVTCFFLTAAGYHKLGIPASRIPADQAFQKGMRQRAALLHDPGSEKWEPGYQEAPDALLLVADDQPDRLEAVVRLMLAGIQNNSVHIIHTQKGEVLRNEKKHGIEHFGYEDALSQPQYLNNYQPGKIWNDACTLDAVLIEDPGMQNAGAAAGCYGSYFVFRKLEQNVLAFKAREEELANLLFPNETDAARELAGAYAVGRFENSDPAVKHRQEMAPTMETAAADNDFDYGFSGDASRCPYHAHIRLTNPRNAEAAMKTQIKGYERPARITRRGIPYDEAGRNSNMNWYPEGKVGLLFMAYQSSITASFEKMQQVLNTADGLIGQDVQPGTQLWPLKWGCTQYQIKGFDFSNFVGLKGGEYFFAPSIPFLKSLSVANSLTKKTISKKNGKTKTSPRQR